MTTVYEWLVFAFLVVLGWVIPTPVTPRQKTAAVVLVVLLVVMALVLIGLLG